MEAKFRNSMSLMALKTTLNYHVLDCRENDKGNLCAYFYAHKEDVDKDKPLGHCYVAHNAEADLQNGNFGGLQFCECSQDDGRTWIDIICPVGENNYGKKGTRKFVIEL